MPLNPAQRLNQPSRSCYGANLDGSCRSSRELRKVELRRPHTAKQYDSKLILLCPGCRRKLRGHWRYAVVRIQSELFYEDQLNYLEIL